MSDLVKRNRESLQQFQKRNRGLPRLSREDMIRPAVEVLSEEPDTATEEFLRRLPFVEPPLSPGVEVKAATLHGFMAALSSARSLMDVAEKPNDNVRITHVQGPKEEPLLLLEAVREGVWSKIAIKGTKTTTHHGFDCVVSGRCVANVAGALASEQELVVVGVDAKGLCIGPYSVPYETPVSAWHAEPVIETPDVRIALPTKDLGNIMDRVAVSGAPGGWADFQSDSPVYLSFGFDEEDHRIWVTAASGRQGPDGGSRMHRLFLEHARVEQVSRKDVMHQGAYVMPPFFAFLREIADGEWVGLELTSRQIVGRGRDFLVVSPAMIPTTSDSGPYPMVELIPPYHDVWIADRDEVLKLASSMMGPGSISIQGKLFVLHDKNTDTEAFAGVAWDMRENTLLSTRRVYVGKDELVNAVKGCPSDTMRIGYGQRRDAETNDLSSYFVFASTDHTYQAKLENLQ